MDAIGKLVNPLRQVFWSENIWLPPNVTWALYETKNSPIKYARFNDLYWSLLTGVFLVLLRFTLERTVLRWIGIAFGIKPRKNRPPPEAPHQELEREYTKSRGKRLDHKIVTALAKRLDLSERVIERWLRRRTAYDRASTMSRWTESLWRATFYAFAFFYGLWTLSDKAWLWDSMECFYNYPHHSVSRAEWWYYNIELGFYLSLLVSQFFDIQRKDFWQMFIHHVVTICLLCFSWACNLHRIGALVLIIHDFADIPLEGAKLARYTRSESASNVIFGVFTVCWIFSRLGLLPWRVIAYSSHYALKVVPMFPAYYIFNALLVSLQILHFVWTWLILRIAYNAMFKDGVKDLRESDETGASQDENTTNTNGSVGENSSEDHTDTSRASPSPSAEPARRRANGAARRDD